jgi:hypothetical protein
LNWYIITQKTKLSSQAHHLKQSCSDEYSSNNPKNIEVKKPRTRTQSRIRAFSANPKKAAVDYLLEKHSINSAMCKNKE